MKKAKHKTKPTVLSRKKLVKKTAPKEAAKEKMPVIAQTMLLSDVQHHDILQMIMDDHKPLKRLINTLKNSQASLSVRRSAFNEFAPLLAIHAKAEENTLYSFIKQETELRTKGFEGDVEHSIADLMVEHLKMNPDKDIWSAKAKVLAELVEQHMDEEEDQLFPDLKKHMEMIDLIRLGEDYLMEKDKIKMDIIHPAVRRHEISPPSRH